MEGEVVFINGVRAQRIRPVIRDNRTASYICVYMAPAREDEG